MSTSPQTKKPRFRFRDIALQVQNKLYVYKRCINKYSLIHILFCSQKERESSAHQTLRGYPGNKNRATKAQEEGTIHGIEHPGSTGVIYVMDRAIKNGFTYASEGWANFGQGAPEGNFVDRMMCCLGLVCSSQYSWTYWWMFRETQAHRYPPRRLRVCAYQWYYWIKTRCG